MNCIKTVTRYQVAIPQRDGSTREKMYRTEEAARRALARAKRTAATM